MRNSQTNSISESNYLHFWKNGIETFWSSNENSADVSIQGFPCFCALLIQSVREGEKGEDDPTSQNNFLYIYPKNIPDNIKSPFIASMVSFCIYSIMNFGSLPNSFLWTDSEISLRNFKFENGDYLVFLLKLPKFSTINSSSYALDRTLHSLSYNIENIHIPIQITSKDEISTFLEKHNQLITFCAFPTELTDPFLFITSHTNLFGASPPLAIATQLDYLILNKSEHVIGTTTLYHHKFVVSSIPHIISRLFPFYSDSVKNFSNHKEQNFDLIPLYIPAQDIKEGSKKEFLTNLDDSERLLLHLAIFTCNNTTVFVLIKDNDQQEEILDEIKELLNNGIEDFAVECTKFSQAQSTDKTAGVAAYWPHSGAFRSSICSSDMLLRIGIIHDEMENNSELLEYIMNNGESQLTALKIISFEAFAETESKSSFRAAIDEAYTKIKQFLPNLPPELHQL